MTGERFTHRTRLLHLPHFFFLHTFTHIISLSKINKTCNNVSLARADSDYINTFSISTYFTCMMRLNKISAFMLPILVCRFFPELKKVRFLIPGKIQWKSLKESNTRNISFEGRQEEQEM